jgi:hypothetical protein
MLVQPSHHTACPSKNQQSVINNLGKLFNNPSKERNALPLVVRVVSNNTV